MAKCRLNLDRKGCECFVSFRCRDHIGETEKDCKSLAASTSFLHLMHVSIAEMHEGRGNSAQQPTKRQTGRSIMNDNNNCCRGHAGGWKNICFRKSRQPVEMNFQIEFN